MVYPLHRFHLIAATEQTPAQLHKGPRGTCPNWPQAAWGHRHKPHIPVNKDKGKQHHPCRSGLHITHPGSGHRWRSLHTEEEPSQFPGIHCNPKPRRGAKEPRAHRVGGERVGPARVGAQGQTDGQLPCSLHAWTPVPASTLAASSIMLKPSSTH